MAALAGRAGRVLAKSNRTQCLNKDLVDTAAVDLTARLVATAGNLPAAEDIRPVVAILQVAVHLRGVTARRVTHRLAELRQAMALRSLVTADIPELPPAVPQVHRRRRARQCSGSVSVVEGCCS